jgi:sulfur-carrier protein
MAVVHLPRSLVALFPEPPPRHLDLDAPDVRALVRELDSRWPGMWDRLCEPGPRLREHINVFVDGDRVSLEAPLEPASVVHVIPAIAGGANESGRRFSGEGDSTAL